MKKETCDPYLVPAVGQGNIVCSVPGLKLVDFYRTSAILAKDVKVQKGGDENDDVSPVNKVVSG